MRLVVDCGWQWWLVVFCTVVMATVVILVCWLNGGFSVVCWVNSGGGLLVFLLTVVTCLFSLSVHHRYHHHSRQ